MKLLTSISGSTTGHEYWLREFDGIDDENGYGNNGELAAMFTSPIAGSDTGSKDYTNNYLHSFGTTITQESNSIHGDDANSDDYAEDLL